MKKLIPIFAMVISLSSIAYAEPEVTICSPFETNNSFTKVAIGIFECLEQDVKTRLSTTRKMNGQFSTKVLNAIAAGKQPHRSDIFLCTMALQRFNPTCFNNLRPSSIKIAYSMFESTALPPKWVGIINQYFDAVVVPDIYIKQTYTHSGVKKPIFVIPLPCAIEQFLKNKIPQTPHTPFTFGSSGTFIERKNFVKLLQGFIDEFGDDSRVQLILHSRTSWRVHHVKNTILKILQDRRVTNVKIIDQMLSDTEYRNLFLSFDAYILISKGEGFSFTPREALAAGIPSILSNNTAHKTICDAGFVTAIPADILVPGRYDQIGNQIFGNFFDCKKEDVQAALRFVFENYSELYRQQEQGRQWVKQYMKENLRLKYISLVNPERILLADRNEVGDDYLITCDQRLYQKYLTLKRT